MAREYEGYRNIIERMAGYPEVLRVPDIMKITGFSRNTISRNVPTVKGKTTKEALARWLCKTYG